MFRQGRAIVGLMMLIGLAGAPSASWAQDDSEHLNARFHVGPLGLSPVINLRNVGWDSNILHNNEEDRPEADFTAVFSPALDASLRLTRIRVKGRGQFDLYYFRNLDDLKAVDNESSILVELPLNRLTPYVGGRLLKTRHRQNLEIDDIAQRQDDAVRAGADLRLTSKASVGFYNVRSHFEYKADSVFRDTDLARSLNRTGTTKGLVFRYAATPLTTLALNVEHSRDRFASSSARNSKSVRVEPSVEFKPLALVSGRAAVGFRKHTFLEGGTQEFKGMVAFADLQYALHARTQLGVGVRRDLEYSYLFSNYLLGGFTTFLTQRIGDRWDVGATVGRFHLNYRDAGSQLSGEPGETTVNTGVSIGYNLGRTARVGLDANYYTRISDVSFGRGYERLQVSSSLTYGF